jgi:hypothetical protein
MRVLGDRRNVSEVETLEHVAGDSYTADYQQRCFKRP